MLYEDAVKEMLKRDRELSNPESDVYPSSFVYPDIRGDWHVATHFYYKCMFVPDDSH
jgi:hypothetical protein